jgi:hypothetical protein
MASRTLGVTVGEEFGLGHAEFFENESDTFVQCAGAGRADTFFAQPFLQRGVSHGGTDRIHVRVAVADNDGFHGKWKDTTRRERKRTQTVAVSGSPSTSRLMLLPVRLPHQRTMGAATKMDE